MYSVIDAMLNLGMPQTPSVPTSRPAPDASREPSDFQKLMDQQNKPETGLKDEVTDTPADTDKPVADGESQAGEEEPGLPTNEQMLLAAMAAAQHVVVPVEEQEVPVQAEAAVEVVQAIPTEQPAVATETKAPSAAPEGQSDAAAEKPQETQPQSVQTAPAETKQSGESRQSEAPVRQDRPVERTGEQSGKGQSTENLEVDADPEAAVKPLFHDVEAAPVKVGSAPEVDQSGEVEPVERQVLRQLETAVKQGESHVRVSLNPESLGSVTVELTRAEDGALHVMLHAESPRTQSLLERSAAGLQSLLMDNTQSHVQVQVERQENSQQGQQHPYDQQNGQGGQQQQQDQPRQRQSRPDVDFMQQLRLGLIPMEGEAS